jgi:protein-tyrosine phosphatase
MDSGARWRHDAILHAWWVEPGRLLAGEYPGARTPEKTATKIRLLVDTGVDSIVDLTTPQDHLESYQAELQVAADNAYPIPDNGVIDQDGYDRILVRIRDEIGSGRRVYLHCWGGKGRTTTVVGCF